MLMVSNLDLIRRVPLFSMLNPEYAVLVAAAMSKRRFKRGETLVQQGQRSEELFIILTGRARVLASGGGGREVILASIRAGEHIGEMSLIDGSVHSATVTAEVQTDVLVLGREDFMRCLPERDTMAFAMLHSLVRRLRTADRRIETLALLDVHGRVARVLQELSHRDEQGRQIIPNKISRQDLAKTVGASREMVSRVMKELEAKGYIQTLETGALILKDYLRTQELP